MNLDAFFAHEVKPTLGCTEPGAVALAAAAAAARLGADPERVSVWLSPQVARNAMHVGVPHSGGLVGAAAAAALGAWAGNPHAGLLVLQDADPDRLGRGLEMLEAGGVKLEVVSGVPAVFVSAEVSAGRSTATAVVAHRHDLVVEAGLDSDTEKASDAGSGLPLDAMPYVRRLLAMDLPGLHELSGTLDQAQEEYMLSGAAMNQAVAEVGLAGPWGLDVGRHLGGTGAPQAVVRAAASADVRMAGGAYPVMGSGGSGNHGLTVIIPLAVAAGERGAGDARLARALCLAHLVTGHVKAVTGRLSPVCGCAVAAGAGLAAGLVQLGGGGPQAGASAVAGVLSSLLGMICDGAKPGCAHKVATAVQTATHVSDMALRGWRFTGPQGVVQGDFAADVRAVGELTRSGFASVDQAVLTVMSRLTPGRGLSA